MVAALVLAILLVVGIVSWLRGVQECEANGGVYVSRFDPCVPLEKG
jgi:hypothetical protein